MKKLISLIRACMTENMSIFKIKTKSKKRITKMILPVFLFVMIFITMCSYADMLIDPLRKVHLEFVMLTIFVLLTSIVTFVEGIYKTSNLIFNCKVDDLLLSLPIKKSTVLFVRVFKFYIFELVFNSMFLIPAMYIYAKNVNVGTLYYVVSIIFILLLPIIPIVISCIIGGIISFVSSKFKMKNIAQTIVTMLLVLGILYISFNLQEILKKLAENAKSINDIITKLYYPAGAYIKLITDFKVADLLIFIVVNILLFAVAIVLLGRIYFKINSKVKSVRTSAKKGSKYKVKTNNVIVSLMKKEFNRFINSPVFIVNAAFGLVMYLIGCIAISIKFEGTINSLISQGVPITPEQIKTYLPVALFGFLCLSSLMTSITSSMISLEGRSFNILKSLPVSPFKIILSKVLTAVTMMIPAILIGDIIMFIRFEFSIFEILVILAMSIIMPIIAEIFGIIVNLKYPKMNAENDTEIVKQSMSSMVSVLGGMGASALIIFGLVKCVKANIQTNIIFASGLGISIVVLAILLIYLNKKGSKDFNDITV